MTAPIGHVALLRARTDAATANATAAVCRAILPGARAKWLATAPPRPVSSPASEEEPPAGPPTALPVNPLIRPPKGPSGRPAFPVDRQAAHRIIATVGLTWGVSVGELCSESRTKRFTRPRLACYRLLWNMTPRPSYRQIAYLLCRADHTSSLSGLRKAEYLYHHDIDWRLKFLATEATLRQTAAASVTRSSVERLPFL